MAMYDRYVVTIVAHDCLFRSEELNSLEQARLWKRLHPKARITRFTNKVFAETVE